MIYLAGDHHASNILNAIRAYLSSCSIPYTEFGYLNGENPKAKLVDFIPKVAKCIQDDPDSLGILTCGTGAGVEIGANRFRGVRASLCASPQMAEWSRVYDNSNTLCLPAWALDEEAATEILAAWLDADFDGSERRLEMLATFDKWM